MDLHEVESESPAKLDRPTASVRPGSTVLTCLACGCRLTGRESRAAGGGSGPDAAWRHFEGNSWDRDARGHLVECADMPHVIVPADEEPTL